MRRATLSDLTRCWLGCSPEKESRSSNFGIGLTKKHVLTIYHLPCAANKVVIGTCVNNPAAVQTKLTRNKVVDEHHQSKLSTNKQSWRLTMLRMNKVGKETCVDQLCKQSQPLSAAELSQKCASLPFLQHNKTPWMQFCSWQIETLLITSLLSLTVPKPFRKICLSGISRPFCQLEPGLSLALLVLHYCDTVGANQG